MWCFTELVPKLTTNTQCRLDIQWPVTPHPLEPGHPIPTTTYHMLPPHRHQHQLLSVPMVVSSIQWQMTITLNPLTALSTIPSRTIQLNSQRSTIVKLLNRCYRCDA